MTWENGIKIKKCKYCGKIGHTKSQCIEYKLEKIEQNRTKRYIKETKKTYKKSNIKSSKKSKSNLIHECDKLWSQWQRKLQVLEYGHCWCFICGKSISYEDACIGHFVSRRYLGCRFLESNTNVICYDCNRIDNNQPKILEYYEERIKEYYGENEIDFINSFKNEKVTILDLEQMAESMKKNLKLLDKDISNKYGI